MSEKILVVDEQLFMLRLIQHTLEKAGYELIKARNGEEARAAMQQETPSLVVADMKSGVHPVLSELQKRDNSPRIPIIHVSDVPKTMSNATGARDGETVFHKPFSPTKLVAEVKRLMPQPSTGGAPL